MIIVCSLLFVQVVDYLFVKNWNRILHEPNFLVQEVIKNGLHGVIMGTIALLGVLQLLLPLLAAEFQVSVTVCSYFCREI